LIYQGGFYLSKSTDSGGYLGAAGRIRTAGLILTNSQIKFFVIIFDDL
jgi:hypothetical protein